MSAQRWERLRVTLSEAGVEATIIEKNHQTGTSRSLWLRHGKDHVVVADRWWHKNPEIWVGWEVCVEDAEGFEVRRWPWAATELGRQR
jgi:hypothetical protein